jgi:hypothetical protein
MHVGHRHHDSFGVNIALACLSAIGVKRPLVGGRSAQWAPAHAVARDDQLSRATQERARTVARFTDETRVDHTLEEESQGDLTLEARERCTKAAMDSATEAEMLVIPSVRVELVGGLELHAVPVRGCQQQDDRAAFGMVIPPNSVSVIGRNPDMRARPAPGLEHVVCGHFRHGNGITPMLQRHELEVEQRVWEACDIAGDVDVVRGNAEPVEGSATGVAGDTVRPHREA